MIRPDPDDQLEPPLDPALERIQAKLRRLILVSGGTLLIGLLAVVFAVIFRVSRDAAPETWTSTVEIPSGATLVSSDVDGDRLALTVEDGAGRRVLVFDLPTGRKLGETAIVGR